VHGLAAPLVVGAADLERAVLTALDGDGLDDGVG
jgi:hypothetical protein